MDEQHDELMANWARLQEGEGEYQMKNREQAFYLPANDQFIIAVGPWIYRT